MARKMLVVDIRGTLMCEFNAKLSPELVESELTVRLQGDEAGRSLILKRPHLDRFLERMASLFDVVAFTSRAQRSADKVLDVLDPDNKIFTRRLYLDSCKDFGKVKDLKVLDRPMESIIILDDTGSKCALNPDNWLPVSRFKRNLDDEELPRLVPFLEELARADVEDVRPLLRARFGVLQQQQAGACSEKNENNKVSMKGHQIEGSGRINALGRALTKILRHRAPHLNLEMRSDGFCKVEHLLQLQDVKTRSGVPLSSHSVDEVLKAVEQNNKQRLSVMRGDDGQLYIRANQGHTIEQVSSEGLLREIKSGEEIPVCVHGTYKHALQSIMRDGLKRMGRNHVHLATGLPDNNVISGMRSNCEVFIFVDVNKAMEDKMKFYMSENGVVLTEGFSGTIPTKYFSKVVAAI